MMKKYVIIGNAQSVHLVKWTKELVKYYELFVISSTNTHKDIRAIVPGSNIFNLNIQVKESGGNLGLLKKYFSVKKILKKIDPDFVNPHYITSHGFLAALIKKTTKFRFKLIQSAWGSDILVTPFKSKIYYLLTEFCLNTSDLVTSDSEYMTKVIKDIFPVQTLTFIFGLDKLPQINIKEKNRSLFYSNRMLSENYNIDKVIRLFHKISATNEDARLLISHDGPKRHELEKLVKDLQIGDRVKFKGFLSHVDQISLYRKSQFYISIPTSDSTSVSLIEAMAYGCIPIVSDIPANKEWIKEGRNGIIYDPQTAFEQAEIILSKQEQIMIENRKIVEKRAIFPKSMKLYVETINKL
jgi:glycosyltransferase involved in cell wall biosynthesis